jgi:hypothetical protein
MPKNIRFTLVQEDETSTLTAYKVPDFDKPLIVDSTHIKWDEILAGVLADDLEVLRLINIADTLSDALISERLTVIGGRLCFDGDEVDDGLSQFVVKMIAAGDPNYPAYVKFVEKLYSNPQTHSREHLFSYLRKYDITITTEGDLLLYKGVNVCPEDKDFGGQKPYRSGSQGPANVSGYEHVSGYVPQAVGDIVSMPRTATWTNPTVACSTGLHVATWGYWHGDYNVNLLVLVNPRDVVSVPHDDAKIRCCRYKIIDDRVTDQVTDIVATVTVPPVPSFIPVQKLNEEVASTHVPTVIPDPTVGFADDWWDAYAEDDIEDEDDCDDCDCEVVVTAVAISPDGRVNPIPATSSLSTLSNQRTPTFAEWNQSIDTARGQKKGHLAYLKRLNSWTLMDNAEGINRQDWLVNN